MKRYSPKEIEPKWQNSWAEANAFHAIDNSKKPKYVMLTEFPYPSGEGMHIGHMREYTLGDVLARVKRMEGYNVLYPMGFDAFGLPTENYAIKHQISPQLATEKNTANFEKQLRAMGFSFDWQRSFKTSDPEYYRWTQWLFLQFFKAGMAYQEEIAVNWCPFCKTGLANEEVVNGRHERCDTPVEKRFIKQWLLRITDYADRLIEGLKEVDYPSRIADQQINWIGRSSGAEVDFLLLDGNGRISVFTTRPDTLYGVTALVLAPEHPMVASITTKEQQSKVNAYLKQVAATSDVERQETNRPKTGVFSGAYASHPLTQERLPIWIADYVLPGYGTGAIMAVPAHDQRDYEFAKQYQLPIKPVIEPISGASQGDEKEKQAIVAAVINPKDNTILLLDWGPRRARHGGTMLIGGGIKEGETAEQAAEREIREETGISQLKLVNQLPYLVHAYYYSNVAEANFYAQMQGLLFSTSQESGTPQLDEQEKGKFKLRWVSLNEAASLIEDEGHRHILEALTSPSAYGGEGLMTNSGELDGQSSSVAREAIVSKLEQKRLGKSTVKFRLRDWIFSRQHYWGEPIPIIHCPTHGPVAVPQDQLPVKLPKVERYEPSQDGSSPLAAITDWVNTTCPECGEPAKRETDTMPNWAGSSWYYLRYFDPKNNQQFASAKALDYWRNVDMYLGGMEHTTLHLLYSRFWHQFFYDQGLVPTREPYAARRGQGIILAADGSKMSKSKGNIVSPTEIIDSGYGADALRLAILFLAPYDQTTPWSPEALGGTFRFLQRIWTLVGQYLEADKTKTDKGSDALKGCINRLVKKLDNQLHEMGFNVAIASLMEAVNELYKIKADDGFSAPQWQWALETLLTVLAPFAPHISEELWQQLGHSDSIHQQSWPGYDNKWTIEVGQSIAVQINGKVRGTLKVEGEKDQQQLLEMAKEDLKIGRYLEASEIVKVILIPGKLLSVVLKK